MNVSFERRALKDSWVTCTLKMSTLFLWLTIFHETFNYQWSTVLQWRLCSAELGQRCSFLSRGNHTFRRISMLMYECTRLYQEMQFLSVNRLVSWHTVNHLKKTDLKKTNCLIDLFTSKCFQRSLCCNVCFIFVVKLNFSNTLLFITIYYMHIKYYISSVSKLSCTSPFYNLI